MTGNQPYISLLELNLLIKGVIETHLEPSYWVVGEVSELSEARSGHCYIELVEKDENSDLPVAKSRANIWAATYRMLKPYFEKTTGQQLSAGIKVLVKVSVRYHEQYGLSLTVTDIEPAFTLGDIELKRQQAIQRLKEEGIFDLNRQLSLDPLARRIAVISSPTAAGYGDFINHLNANIYGFRFSTVLFPAYMQGADAVDSMIAAMEKVFRYADFFDAIVIIRGGGSRSELACFDSYELAAHICQIPIPVLSGIGHERDVSVADMVSFSRFKTPTATAQFLIDNIENSVLNLENIAERIFQTAQEMISDAGYKTNEAAEIIIKRTRQLLKISELNLVNLKKNLRSTSKYKIATDNGKLTNKELLMRSGTMRVLRTGRRSVKEKSGLLQPVLLRILKGSSERLELFNRICQANSPEKIIKKGFSVTRINGRTLKKLSEINPGDIVETQISDGKIISKTESIIAEI